MSHKKININPDLFNIGSKTKKNRDKKVGILNKPLISPNILKNKLLKRIKEFKKRETSSLENNKTKLNENTEGKESVNMKVDTTTATETYSDEFNDSINFLQSLSKQKKLDEEKLKYERLNQKRKEELERKTVKNHEALLNSVSTSNLNSPLVNIDLPDELKETLIVQNPNSNTFTISQPRIDTVPYGVLKNGSKPTYRTWNKTQRNMIVTNPQSALVIENNTNLRQSSEREQRLNHLKEKIKQKQADEINQQNELVV
jgi:hypothetical protein